MAFSGESRKYQRCSNLVCKTQMSIDEKRWVDFEISDISAGGLKFISSNVFEKSVPLSFILNVFNMLSEFNLKFEGQITRVEMTKGKYEYAVRFSNIDKYTQIQLDEVIKSKITLNHISHCAPEDGSYTFLLMPHNKSSHYRKTRLY